MIFIIYYLVMASANSISNSSNLIVFAESNDDILVV